MPAGRPEKASARLPWPLALAVGSTCLLEEMGQLRQGVQEVIRQRRLLAGLQRRRAPLHCCP
eukprot:2791558-Prorocentrum_lima.AAC.1